MIKGIIKSLRKSLASFEEQCCNPPIPYEIKGITNVEAFYWWSIVDYYRPDIILESGVYRGRSTHILAKAQEYFNIPYHFAFEIDNTYEKYVRDKLSPFKTIYEIKDSIKGFSEVMEKFPKSKITAFLDGPKYGKPFSDIFRVLSSHKHLCSIASHDCYPDSTTIKAFSYCMKKYFKSKECLFTSKENNLDLLYLNNYIKKDFDSFYSKAATEKEKNSFNHLGFYLT